MKGYCGKFLLLLVFSACTNVQKKEGELARLEYKVHVQENFSEWEKIQGPKLASDNYKCDKKNSIIGNDLAMPLCYDFKINKYLLYLLSSAASRKEQI
ncbi:MAG: hypothetical protein VX642_09605 [Bdellovibrionota bacterium]|nr:hypothetical protein [Bdellovibrionota bacterium]